MDAAGRPARGHQGSVESTRRALDKLSKAGVVQLDWIRYRTPGRSHDGTVTRYYLAARLTPDPLTQQKIDAAKEPERRGNTTARRHRSAAFERAQGSSSRLNNTGEFSVHRRPRLMQVTYSVRSRIPLG